VKTSREKKALEERRIVKNSKSRRSQHAKFAVNNGEKTGEFKKTTLRWD